MVTKRQERENRNAAKRRRAWDVFVQGLRECRSLEDGRALYKRAPGQGMPGRGFYSNFAFFLNNAMVPRGASYEELRLYLDFNRMMHDSGLCHEGGGQRREKMLLEGMDVLRAGPVHGYTPIPDDK